MLSQMICGSSYAPALCSGISCELRNLTRSIKSSLYTLHSSVTHFLLELFHRDRVNHPHTRLTHTHTHTHRFQVPTPTRLPFIPFYFFSTTSLISRPTSVRIICTHHFHSVNNILLLPTIQYHIPYCFGYILSRVGAEGSNMTFFP